MLIFKAFCFQNGWESLRKNTQTGPKKLDELHNEIKMEKLQELIDLQEYDANKQGSPGGQRGNRAFYQGIREAFSSSLARLQLFLDHLRSSKYW